MELSNHENTVNKLKYILQSENKQPEMATHSTSATIGHSGKGKTMERVNR